MLAVSATLLPLMELSHEFPVHTPTAPHPPAVLRKKFGRHRHCDPRLAPESRAVRRAGIETGQRAGHSDRSAFCAEGEAGHLPLHVRRAVAHRLVRLQAETE